MESDEHGQLLGRFIVTGDTVAVYVKTGEVLSGRVDALSSGNIFLVGRRLVSLTPDGKQRVQVDFGGGPQSEAAATLGLDGASLYVRDHRGLTKFTGL